MRAILPIAALVSALAAGPVLAQQAYDVDVVVFEHVDSRGAESERWRPEVVVPLISEAAAFNTRGPRGERLRELPEGFERLSAEDGDLVEAVERLEDAEAYRVLRHASWRQPALGADDAVALRLQAGEPMTVQIPPDAYPRPPEERADSVPEEDNSDGQVVYTGNANSDLDDAHTYMPDTPFGMGMLAAPRRDTGILPLDGTVKLVVSRYLHLHADLYYTTAVAWEEENGGEATASESRSPAATELSTSSRISRGPDGEPMLSYGFQQERRMRSGELHYLDHPVLGLLVKVTPHEPDA
ncbi:MAG: CsiV family protein [Halofilum sp. (in: g-proteobacteria)]